jgi:uncharacterized RDD family membrane protein YckC
MGQLFDSAIYIAILLTGAVSTSVTEDVFWVLIGASFALLYLLFQDGMEKGQSWGKKLVNTRVIDARTAKPCTFGQSFLRNLLLVLLNWIDWVFIFGYLRQRLGDRAAHTVVIEDSAWIAANI